MKLCEHCGETHELARLCQPRLKLSRRRFLFMSAAPVVVGAAASQYPAFDLAKQHRVDFHPDVFSLVAPPIPTGVPPFNFKTVDKTVEKMAKDSLLLLQKDLMFAGAVNRSYDIAFDGRKAAMIVNIRKPVRYQVRGGQRL